MKWMGWSWDDYQNAPADLTRKIVDYINAEHERTEKISKGRKGGSVRTDFHTERDSAGRARVVQDKEKPKTEEVVTVDAKGNEIVTKTRPDGSVVTHRKKSPAEELMHQMFGTPPSWKNK